MVIHLLVWPGSLVFPERFSTTQIQISVFIATSLDGFIARPDGDLDWLPVPGEDEDYGYHAFMDSVDCLVKHVRTDAYPNGFVQSVYDVGERAGRS